MVSFGRRIKEVRRKLGIKQQDMARALHISGSYLSEVEAGKSKAGFDLFFYISEQFNVNLHYLLHGIGPMFSPDDSEPGVTATDYGECGDKIEEMLDYFEISPIVKLSVLEFFLRYLYDHEEAVQRDIEKNRRQ